MTLPDGFLFSQSNLQDYVDCQRRFQLRHMLHLAWPAVEAEPYLENERRIDQGEVFHKIVHQYLVGIPERDISQAIGADEQMQAWWDNFLHEIKSGNLASIFERSQRRYEEITLSVPMGKYRLIAKYDLLIACVDGKVIILDWKTSQNHPKRQWLAGRLQTHVYPYILVEALPGLLDVSAIEPAEIEMLYWFSNHPQQPEKFTYSPREYKEDKRLLNGLVATIEQKSDPIFPLTPDVRRCLYCTYRSLCNRGVKPGDVLQMEEWEEPVSAEEVSLDLDQIGEIEL